MIQDRNLTAGTKLVGRYHKQDRTCETHLDENGKLYFRLDDGRAFKSPSAAGTAVTGHACDGWHFWSVVGTEPKLHLATMEEIMPAIDDFREQVKAEKVKAIPTYDETVAKVKKMEKTEKPKPPKTGVYKLPNQKGAPAGLTRYYCFDCSSPFPAKSDIKNPACPNCHPAK
jgi:Restriction Enzyme Adenine Methylase Associated